MKQLGMVVGLIGALVVIVLVCLLLPLRSKEEELAPRCPLADEAHLDFHPLTPDYIGRLIAQQLKDDGVKDDQVPQGYELRHAAYVVSNSCLP